MLKAVFSNLQPSYSENISEECWEQHKFLSSKYCSFVHQKLLVSNIDFDETRKKSYRFTAKDLLMLDLGLLKKTNFSNVSICKIIPFSDFP